MKKYLKLYLLSVIIIMFIFVMFGCNKAQSEIQYDNKSDISEMQKQDLTEEIERLNRPNEIQMSMNVVNDIDTLKSKGIVKIIRFNNDKYYSITPIKENKYLLLLYDKNNDGTFYVVDGFLASTIVNKSSFKDISVGMNREDIIKKDPSACVVDNFSYHRFSDKSILRIKYDKDNKNQYIVSEYNYLENPVSVLDYLLPQDLEKIK